jgi:hypothetical protein
MNSYTFNIKNFDTTPLEIHHHVSIRTNINDVRSKQFTILISDTRRVAICYKFPFSCVILATFGMQMHEPNGACSDF